jgi:hypothetical protein
MQQKCQCFTDKFTKANSWSYFTFRKLKFFDQMFLFIRNEKCPKSKLWSLKLLRACDAAAISRTFFECRHKEGKEKKSEFQIFFRNENLRSFSMRDRDFDLLIYVLDAVWVKCWTKFLMQNTRWKWT